MLSASPLPKRQIGVDQLDQAATDRDPSGWGPAATGSVKKQKRSLFVCQNKGKTVT